MNLHIIYTPWTGVGLHGGFRGNSWLSHRIEIFKNYTLKSLMAQTNKDFIHWMSWRPEERFNPHVKALSKYLDDLGYRYVFTFDGLMYHDDKFSNTTLRLRAKNFLQMVMDGFNSGHFKSPREIWKYTFEKKNASLVKRIGYSLEVLQDLLGKDYDWVYMTRIDSDDMFNVRAIELIQNQPPAPRKALSFKEGYMYNVVTKQLGEWLPPTNPPFHTIIFPGYIFFDAQSHKDYYRDFASHEDIPRVFACETLDMNQYCVTAHGKDHISTSWDVPTPKRLYQDIKYRGFSHTTSGKNISTRWESRVTHQKNHMLGKEFTDPEEKKHILAQFGI